MTIDVAAAIDARAVEIKREPGSLAPAAKRQRN